MGPGPFDRKLHEKSIAMNRSQRKGMTVKAFLIVPNTTLVERKGVHQLGIIPLSNRSQRKGMAVKAFLIVPNTTMVERTGVP